MDIDRKALTPDCSNCFALCCTAFGFSRSADFAIDKPAATPCRNLAQDFSCSIHDRLRPRGFRGCTVFDCFGAGQAVSQELYKGISWRDAPETKTQMFAAFKVQKQLHEMLWHLAEAQARTFSPELASHAQQLRLSIEAARSGGVQTLLALDTESLHAAARETLLEVSEEIRAGYFASGNDDLGAELVPGADLLGADLRGRRLCGADLRGAYLIAADLRGCDLSGVDLLGADLRDAKLDGADLAKALFLTQPQLSSAHGSVGTLLPPGLAVPEHWQPDAQLKLCDQR